MQAIACLSFIAMLTTSCARSQHGAALSMDSSPANLPVITTQSGLKYQVLSQGAGPIAAPGESVRIHETTMLEDGTQIDSTRTRNQPLKFLLGGGQVIAGVDEGVTGMKVGERRRLIVPPALNKRTSYPPNLSPDATLLYDIELVAIIAK